MVGCYRLGSSQVHAQTVGGVAQVPAGRADAGVGGRGASSRMDQRWQCLGTWLMWHALELARSCPPCEPVGPSHWPTHVLARILLAGTGLTSGRAESKGFNVWS